MFEVKFSHNAVLQQGTLYQMMLLHLRFYLSLIENCTMPILRFFFYNLGVHFLTHALLPIIALL